MLLFLLLMLRANPLGMLLGGVCNGCAIACNVHASVCNRLSSGSLSAHIRLVGIVEVVVLIRQSPHKCRVVLGLPHEVARGGIPLCGQFHVGIEGLSAVRHVSPSGMFFLPLWTTAGVYGYPDVADGKNRLEEEINFSQRFTTALTWCFSTHATPSCLRALFSS